MQSSFKIGSILALLSATLAVTQAAQAEPSPSPLRAPKYRTDASCKLTTLAEDFKAVKALDASKWAVELQGAKPLEFAADGLRMHLARLADSMVIGSQKVFNKGTFSIKFKSFAAPGVVSTAVVRPSAAQAEGGDEIDIVEVIGARPTKPELVAWHKATTPGGPASYVENNGNPAYAAVNLGADSSVAFHNYTAVWDSDNVSWYYDDKWVFTVALAAAGPERLTQDMRFKFGPWISSSGWSGFPDFATFADPYMTVDSVYVQGCLVSDSAPASSSSSSSAAPVVSKSATTLIPGVSTSASASATGSASAIGSASASASVTKNASVSASASVSGSATAALPTGSIASSSSSSSSAVIKCASTTAANSANPTATGGAMVGTATGTAPSGTASATGLPALISGIANSTQYDNATGAAGPAFSAAPVTAAAAGAIAAALGYLLL